MMPASFYVEPKDVPFRRNRLPPHPHLVLARPSTSFHQTPSSRPPSRPPQQGDYERMPLIVSSRTSYSHDTLLPGTYLPPGTHPTQIPHKLVSKSARQHQKSFTSTTTTTQTSYRHKSLSHKPFPHGGMVFQDEDDSHLLPYIDFHHRGMVDPALLNFPCEQTEETREEAGNRFLQTSACFPELPGDAHLLLFRMGIDIFECTEVDFHPLLPSGEMKIVSNTGETQRHCLAVLAKKVLSAQVWLLVFKVHEDGVDGERSSVVFNRLLTLSCGLWMRSSVVVELSAPSTDNVLFKLRSAEDTERFFRLLFQSCTVRWNRPQIVGDEDQVRIQYRMPGATALEPMEQSWSPSPRGPFTLAAGFPEEELLEEVCDWKALASDMDSNWRTPRAFQQSQSHLNIGAGGDASSGHNEYTFETGEVIVSLKGVEVHVDAEGTFPGDRGVYKSFGKGNLRVISHGKGADEVVFTNTDGLKGRDFSHFIFKWTSPMLRDQDPCFIVLWKGATTSFGKQAAQPAVLPGESLDTLDGTGVFEVPTNKKFCAFFDTKDGAQRLATALEQGVDKSCNKGGVRGHIDWYISSRCGALLPPTSNAPNDSDSATAATTAAAATVTAATSAAAITATVDTAAVVNTTAVPDATATATDTPLTTTAIAADIPPVVSV